MAGFFPIFFKNYWATGKTSTFYLGMANSIAAIIVAILAPILGAIADKGSSKKKFLMFFAFLGVMNTGSLWMVAQGNWILAIIFFIGGTIGFSGGNVFYDALLPGVASKSKYDYVSSLGFALGYIGGGLLFLVNVLMFQKPALFGIPDGATAIKISFLSVAIWWAIFSIPVFLFVKEPVIEKKLSMGEAVKSGLKELAATFNEIRHLKYVLTFLLAYWLYIDGVDTVIKMSIDYGMSLGFDSSSLIIALLMVQFIAFPATLLMNLLASKVGPKQAILTAIAGYIFITIMAYFMKESWHFYTLAGAVGLFQGGIQALSRSIYARIIPANKAGEYFGFYNMLGKFAAVIGPFMMGTITLVTGNVRIGILSIVILFVAGGILLMKVNIQEGEKAVKELE